jgi:NADH-quinone oxidoreductase subunit K
VTASMVPSAYYLVLSAILFTLGAVGVLIRRNALVMIMSVELMLNAVNLTLIAYSRFLGNVDGQIFVLLVMAVAAAEVAVGLAIIVSFYRHRETVDVDEMNSLKW